MLEEEAKNCVIKSITGDVNEEIIKINDMIFREAGADESIVVDVKRHPAW